MESLILQPKKLACSITTYQERKKKTYYNYYQNSIWKNLSLLCPLLLQMILQPSFFPLQIQTTNHYYNKKKKSMALSLLYHQYFKPLCFALCHVNLINICVSKMFLMLNFHFIGKGNQSHISIKYI